MTEISVVIPTYNRASQLRACLGALARQTQPASDFDVIVVVDGSTDGTLDMLAALATPYALRVCRQENRGQPAALNRGIDEAAGRYCLFLDDDIIADPGLVAVHLRAQQASGGALVLGHLDCRLPPAADGFARRVSVWWQDHYARLQRGERALSYMDCFSGNLSAPLAALRAVGGFAVDLSRSFDVELGYRLVQHGLALTYLPEAIGIQQYDKQFRQIVKDAEREGEASLALYRRHPPMIADLPLGQFASAPPRGLLLRRLLLAVDMPAEVLRAASWLVGRGSRAKAWYSFVYTYAYWRAVRKTVPDPDAWERLTRGPVILMYHAIGHRGESPSRYVVPADAFRRQMRWLKRRGYRVLRLEELDRLRREYRLPPGRSVVITLDDGYLENYTLAGPILRRLDFPATIFLVSGAVGTANRWDTSGALAGRRLMDWPMIRTMRRWTIDYGAHTRTHRALTSVPEDELDGEIGGSRADLEQALGEPVVAFAYPYGQHDEAVRSAVGRAGFDVACGVADGVDSAATPRRALHRVEIFGTDSLVRFALAVWLGDGLRRSTLLRHLRL